MSRQAPSLGEGPTTERTRAPSSPPGHGHGTPPATSTNRKASGAKPQELLAERAQRLQHPRFRRTANLREQSRAEDSATGGPEGPRGERSQIALIPRGEPGRGAGT